MRRLSDTGMRRLAWVVWWVMPVSFAVSLPVMYADPRTSGSWSNGQAAFDVMLMSFPLVGLLILRRQPRNAVGWLLEGVGLAWGVGGFFDTYAIYGLVIHPGSLPGAGIVAALSEGMWVPGIGLMGTFLILLYPDGHLPSPRWRPVAWLSAITLVVVMLVIDFLPSKMSEGPVPDMTNPIGWEAGEGVLTVLLIVFLPLVPISILACATGLVTRFRRARGVERQQLKWLATAGAVVAFLYLLTMVSVLLIKSTALTQTPVLDFLQNAALLSFVLLPVAIGMAILRHGLYEIDVVIKRTLVYAVLTATLLGIYLGSVLLLQLLLSPLTEKSDFAVAGSTLAAAALFGPVRRRIQLTVDRRFYRSKYDAARTVDEFGARLRHQVDLDAVGADLRGVVHASVQPAYVTLWIRP